MAYPGYDGGDIERESQRHEHLKNDDMPGVLELPVCMNAVGFHNPTRSRFGEHVPCALTHLFKVPFGLAMSDPSFPYRLALGLIFFAGMGLSDLIRHPDNPKRVKEYGFLFGVSLVAMAYGIVHDFVTYTLSPDYFIIGKGLTSAVGGFNRDVVFLAMNATWTVGVLGAAVILVANNPNKLGHQLSYRSLTRLALIPFGVSLLFEIPFGVLSHVRADAIAPMLSRAGFSQDLGTRFITVWAMHLGAYIGAIIGLVFAVVTIIKRKRKLRLLRH